MVQFNDYCFIVLEPYMKSEYRSVMKWIKDNRYNLFRKIHVKHTGFGKSHRALLFIHPVDCKSMFIELDLRYHLLNFDKRNRDYF